MIESPPSFVVREECEKAAWQNGFRRAFGGPPGWAGFASTTVPGAIHLAAGGPQGPWYLALDHSGVIEELALPPAALPGPGLSRHAFGSLGELYGVLSRVYQLSASLPDAPLRVFEQKVRSLPQTTEAERLVVQRIGQDIFRASLMEYWRGACPLTGITDPALLRASHIVPWRVCETDAQRLDVHNGLLLSALWDAAFDQGLVTFSDEGTPVFSPSLSEAARRELRWSAALYLTRRQRENLAWHRVHAFRSNAAATEQQIPTNSVN
ncbi:MAG: HNH endonuclease [Gammaproteobacteria bacterium]|nr:MAG: HNH endonuclease [Gammaproteobacteria bacterium]